MRPWSFVALALVPLTTVALAQTKGPSESGSAAATSSAPAPKPSASDAPPPRPMAGYSYGGSKPDQGSAQPRPAQPRIVHAAPKATGPVATLPGFEMLGDGSSRIFVQLTQTVPVEERKAKGALTYVLKGAHVTVHNNTNPLVTVHFNTPVTDARLRQAGNDLLLLINLRAATNPTWKITPAKEGGAILQIDFPKGTFVEKQSTTATPPATQG